MQCCSLQAEAEGSLSSASAQERVDTSKCQTASYAIWYEPDADTNRYASSKTMNKTLHEYKTMRELFK